ncbi:MAG: hypothetical protein PHS42_08740 [Sulfurimonas sp.]|nr:hypothetical protein [Sulfurimonas sp.]MDD3835546.1 hypothetical protein [Sulfurimonas sp.]
MALINCPECEKKVSDQAKECIGCGYPLREEVAQGNQQVEDKTDIKLECPVEIKGDEVLKKPDGGFAATIGTIIFVIGIFTLFAQEIPFIGSVIITLISVPFFYIDRKNQKPVEEEYERVNKIYEYFKKQYPILKEFNPDKHSVLDTVNISSKDSNLINFNTYMQAHKLKADYIVINDSNSSSHVSGSFTTRGSIVPGNIKSTNTFHANISFIAKK